MRVAVAGIRGAWSSERLAGALREAGAESFVFSCGELVHDLVAGTVDVRGGDLAAVDAVVVKKLAAGSDAWVRLRLHALRALADRGVRIFSPPDVIDRAMDRYRMTMLLVAAGLPVPATLATGGSAVLADAVARLGDCVLKPVYTSKGRGMVRVGAAGADAGAALPVDDRPCLAQRFVAAPGRDIGATVVGGRFIGAFYRVAPPGGWMTTTAAGGAYAPCTLGQRGIAYAERAAAAFGLAYTVVDLVEQGDDFLVYEVSAFGGFRGLLEASGVDAAAAYAAHVVRELGG